MYKSIDWSDKEVFIEKIFQNKEELLNFTRKEKEIVKLSLEMAKIITNKNFENDESVISLINPVLEQFRGTDHPLWGHRHRRGD